MLIVAVSFYVIWGGSAKSSVVEDFNSVQIYAPVDVSGLTANAAKLINGLENNSGVPIPAPTAKLGKTNPFSDPE